MADATPPATEDPSLRTSVLRNLGGAVGLVVLMAAVFGALGMIGREATPTPIAAESPEEATESQDDAADDPDAGDEGEADEPSDDPDGSTTEAEDAATDEGEAADEPEAEPTEEPEDAADEAADEAEDDAADDEGTEDVADEPASPAIPPGDISIQVLDGHKTDGGAAARGVASTLRDRGYRVVAENQALNYDRTTVLWTEGNEAAARQVAADIGAAEVREQPGNLSSSVSVHVVVGADRA